MILIPYLRKPSAIFMILIGMSQISLASILEVRASLVAVKVFENQAQIVREVQSISLSKGLNRLAIGHLSQHADASSFELNIGAGAAILSQTYSIDQGTDLFGTYKVIKDSIARLDRIIQQKSSVRYVKEKLRQLILDNGNIEVSDKSIYIEDLEELSIYFERKLNKIQDTLLILDSDIGKWNERKSLLMKQLAKLEQGGAPANGRIELAIYCEQPVQSNLEIRYLVNRAGWRPEYQLEADLDNKKVLVTLTAHVSQRTGVDWSSVPVSIASGWPRNRITLPIPNPWRMGFVKEDKKATLSKAYQGREIMAYDSDTRAVRVEQRQDFAQMEYLLKDAQDIEANGADHSMIVSQISLEATFIHKAVVSQSTQVFLVAQIKDWFNKGLIQANARLKLNGYYSGSTYLSLTEQSDTLEIGFGEDKQVYCQRNLLRDKSGKQLLGTKRKEEKAYSIIIRNGHALPIAMEIVDQIPISSDEDIEITLIRNNGGRHAAQTGLLKWDEVIAAGNRIEKGYSYSVKYPKDRLITHN